eukprot:scaffold4273_cov106-Isochrysis_galbana.AAC.2
MALVDDFAPDLIGLHRLLLVGPRVSDQLGLDLQRRSNSPGFCNRGHFVISVRDRACALLVSSSVLPCHPCSLCSHRPT